jgi:hypothetical protein
VNFGILLDASVNASSAHHNTHYDRPLLAMVSGYFYGTNRGITKNPQTKVKIIPRTMYEDQMGIMWTSEAEPFGMMRVL